MANACLPEKYTQGMLNKAMTQLEACRRRLAATKERVVAKSIHRILTAGAAGLLREHLHTQAIPEKGPVVDAVKGLLEARNRHSQQPIAAPSHL